MTRIYLDYAATTPIDPRVLRAMQPYFSEKFGNPGSLHSFGQEAITALDNSREAIAKSIGADFREIIFTGSATEANNLALRGALKWFKGQAMGVSDKQTLNPSGHTLRPRIIVSAIEHESVLETARSLERDSVEVIYLPVGKNGVVDLKKLEESLNNQTILVSVMYANNEIGTIQPIAEISQVLRNFREARSQKLEAGSQKSALPLFHADAAQAFQFLDCDVNKLGMDLMTLSAHKIYGPKGAGALYVRGSRVQGIGFREEKKLNPNDHALHPILTGGGQEFGLRSGTENVPFIVGFAKAVELVSNSRELENKRIGDLRDYFWSELQKIYPMAQTNTDYTQNGTEGGQSQSAASQHMSVFLPNIINLYFPRHKAEELLTKFDIAGLAASSGSACRSRAVESSHVIEALGFNKERAKRSIRFSFGRPTTKNELDKALEIIKINTK
mgnify:CR=1 FL=1